MRWREISLCIGILAILALACGAPGEQDIRAVTPAEADSLMAANRGNPDFVILDIRTPEEYNLARIAGAISFDLMKGTFPKKLGTLDKQKVYLLYCNEDSRSPEAMDIMKSRGFRAVYRITGGLKAWALAGFPVERTQERE